jgi:hypothetical protein
LTHQKTKIIIFGPEGEMKQNIVHWIETHQKDLVELRNIEFLSFSFVPSSRKLDKNLQIGDVTFSVWDLREQLHFRRNLWELYTTDWLGLIVLVNVRDPDLRLESKTLISYLLSIQLFYEKPWAILTDHAGSKLEDDFLTFLGMNEKLTRKMKPFIVNSVTGEGILESLDWLLSLKN